jgi:DNA-binding transcriptional ArsR family regulator
MMMRSAGLSSDSVTVSLRALADPTRLRVYRLLRGGESCVCEMATSLSLAENLISHHLAVLRKTALVRARTDDHDAQWVYYSLDRYTALGAGTHPSQINPLAIQVMDELGINIRIQ